MARHAAVANESCAPPRAQFPTENGPQQAHVASNQVRLQPHESALQSCLQDLSALPATAQTRNPPTCRLNKDISSTKMASLLQTVL